MENGLNTLMLVCAVSAALAAGVLLGYVICKGLFGLFNLCARSQAAAKKPAEAQQAVSA